MSTRKNRIALWVILGFISSFNIVNADYVSVQNVPDGQGTCALGGCSQMYAIEYIATTTHRVSALDFWGYSSATASGGSLYVDLRQGNNATITDRALFGTSTTVTIQTTSALIAYQVEFNDILVQSGETVTFLFQFTPNIGGENYIGLVTATGNPDNIAWWSDSVTRISGGGFISAQFRAIGYGLPPIQTPYDEDQSGVVCASEISPRRMIF